LAHSSDILKMFSEIKAIQKLDKLEDSIRLGQLFIDFRLLVPFERDPRQEKTEPEARKKYPKFIVPARLQFQKMADKGFYMWNVPKPRGKLALFLFIGVIIAIAFMLFHLWPMWLKIGIWYFSFYTLIVLVGFILLRLVVWLFLFHFGLDFWILPNFFIDSNDIMDSFKPLLSFERRQDDLKMILLRLASAVTLIFFVI
jgi:translocation protein SEC62